MFSCISGPAGCTCPLTLPSLRSSLLMWLDHSVLSLNGLISNRETIAAWVLTDARSQGAQSQPLPQVYGISLQGRQMWFPARKITWEISSHPSWLCTGRE